MLERLERYEAEYRRRLAGATLVTVAAHAALVVWLQLPPWWRMQSDEESLRLGYRGPTRPRELDVLEPNSVQAWFHQKAREGRARAIEYRVLQPIDLQPGPRPLPLQREVPPEPVPEPQIVPDDSPETIEPILATHRELPTSADCEIVKLVKPDYPEYEQEMDIGGKIRVGAYATPDGDLVDEVLLDAAMDPPAASSRGLELATIEAIRQWQVRLLSPRARARGGVWIYVQFVFDPHAGVSYDVDDENSR